MNFVRFALALAISASSLNAHSMDGTLSAIESHARVQVFNVEDDVSHSIFQRMVLEPTKEKLKAIVDDIFNISNYAGNPISNAITASEAQELFTDYVVEYMNKHEALESNPDLKQDFFQILFSPKFFKNQTSVVLTEQFSNSQQGDIITVGSRLFEEISSQKETELESEAYWRSLKGKMKETAYLFSNPIFSQVIHPEKRAKIITCINEGNLSSDFEGRAFLKIDQISSLVLSTQEMMKTTSSGDVFICLGNTPALITRVLRRLTSEVPGEEAHRSFIDLPFSGSPNRARIAFSAGFSSEHDMTCAPRMKHFRNVLVQKGLSPENLLLDTHTVWIIDIVNSGSGPAFLIEELIRSYRHASKTLPRLKMLTINPIQPELSDNHKNMTKPDDLARLFLPNATHPAFSVEYQTVAFREDVSHALDKVADEFRLVPSYNACFWNADWDYRMTRERSPLMEEFLAYFDQHVTTLLDR